MDEARGTNWHEEVLGEMGWHDDDLVDEVEAGLRAQGVVLFPGASWDLTDGRERRAAAEWLVGTLGDLGLEVRRPDVGAQAEDEVADAAVRAEFRAKLASVAFAGRGKADRSRWLASRGRDVADADRSRRNP